MSKQDPKHGRWILPLVVGGIVLFTYIFVNALPPGSVPDSTTTTTTEVATATTTTSTSTTTTTTLPDDVADFLTEATDIGEAAATLLLDAQTINQGWDDRTVGLSVIREELARIEDATGTLLTTTQGVTPPEAAAGPWSDVVNAVSDMDDAARAMVTGLESADTGEARRTALADFEAGAADVEAAIAIVETAARTTGT